MIDFNIIGGSLKNPIFRGGGGAHEKPVYRGYLRGAWRKKGGRGSCF